MMSTSEDESYQPEGDEDVDEDDENISMSTFIWSCENLFVRKILNLHFPCYILKKGL